MHFHRFYPTSLKNYELELSLQVDWVAEWLRRWTANPMGSARVGSNPILVEIFQKNFRYRELNPGHLGESQVS